MSIYHCSIFQLTPSRRATGKGRYLWDWLDEFQLTPSRRATYTESADPSTRVFQLTPSRRATFSPSSSRFMMSISTHALTEGDLCLFTLCGHKFYISTHALTEGDCFDQAHHVAAVISTHALTEGDRKTESVLCIDNISTHALTEGDVHASTFFLWSRNFNSRPHGGRRATVAFCFYQMMISTHALTEGDRMRNDR